MTPAKLALREIKCFIKFVSSVLKKQNKGTKTLRQTLESSYWCCLDKEMPFFYVL